MESQLRDDINDDAGDADDEDARVFDKFSIEKCNLFDALNKEFKLIKLAFLPHFHVKFTYCLYSAD